MQKLSLPQKWILAGLLIAAAILLTALIWTSAAGASPAPAETAPGSVFMPAPPGPSETAVFESPFFPVPETPGPEPTRPPPAKLIALTFDDGPWGPTERLLDALRERGLRATFFVIGDHAGQYPGVLKRMAGEGHEIGNHTMNHKRLDKLPAASVKKELSDCSDLIEELTGIRPRLMRAPTGEITPAHMRELERQGLACVYWSVDTKDWRAKSAGEIIEAAYHPEEEIHAIRDGAIVLMHDFYETSVDAAVELMDRLVAEGYQLVTVSELLTIRKGGVEPGRLYGEGFKAG